MPEIDLRLITRPDADPIDAGEGLQGPTVAASAYATGSRARNRSITPASTVCAFITKTK
jgi:hypothetical protein